MRFYTWNMLPGDVMLVVLGLHLDSKALDHVQSFSAGNMAATYSRGHSPYVHSTLCRKYIPKYLIFNLSQLCHLVYS